MEESCLIGVGGKSDNYIVQIIDRTVQKFIGLQRFVYSLY